MNGKVKKVVRDWWVSHSTDTILVAWVFERFERGKKRSGKSVMEYEKPLQLVCVSARKAAARVSC